MSMRLGLFLALLVLGSAAYTVRPGDTMGSIAAEIGVSVGELAALNNIDKHQSRVT